MSVHEAEKLSCPLCDELRSVLVNDPEPIEFAAQDRTIIAVSLYPWIKALLCRTAVRLARCRRCAQGRSCGQGRVDTESRVQSDLRRHAQVDSTHNRSTGPSASVAGAAWIAKNNATVGRIHVDVVVYTVAEDRNVGFWVGPYPPAPLRRGRRRGDCRLDATCLGVGDTADQIL